MREIDRFIGPALGRAGFFRFDDPLVENVVVRRDTKSEKGGVKLDRSTKEKIVADLTERFGRAKSVTFSEFKGLTVDGANQIRRSCRDAGIEYIVVKNTLIYLSLPETIRDEIKPSLAGTTAVALDYEEGVIGPKTLAEFAKDHPEIVIKSGILEDKVLDAAGMTQLAKLPGREELLAKIVGSVQAPARNVLGCVNGVSQKLAGLMRAYHDKLEKEAA